MNTTVGKQWFTLGVPSANTMVYLMKSPARLYLLRSASTKLVFVIKIVRTVLEKIASLLLGTRPNGYKFGETVTYKFLNTKNKVSLIFQRYLGAHE
jgi:hypothetical protein